MNVDKLNKDLVEIALLVTELTAIGEGLKARCKDLEADRDKWREMALRLSEPKLNYYRGPL